MANNMYERIGDLCKELHDIYAVMQMPRILALGLSQQLTPSGKELILLTAKYLKQTAKNKAQRDKNHLAASGK